MFPRIPLQRCPVQAADLFSLPPSLALFADYFRPGLAPWEWVTAIRAALASDHGLPAADRGKVPPGVHLEGEVFLHPSVRLPATATLIGPLWVGEGSEIRPGAFLRGNVLVGARAVLGNACEFKNCLLLDDVQVPHFSYVGDSVLGNRAHLGAGVICSNLRLDQQPIAAAGPAGSSATGLRKLGALVGDAAEVGCNAVLNPGAVLGRRSLVMPTLAFSGYLPPGMIAKARQVVTLLKHRDHR